MKKGPNRTAQAAFLEAFVQTGANITQASSLAGIDRQSHYDWMATDPTYPERFEEANEAARDAVEAEIKRRGQDGYDEPIVYKGAISKDENGKPVCVRKFSDVLLIVRAKAMMPEKYRDRSDVKGELNGTLKVELNGNVAVEHRRSRLVGIIRAHRERLGTGGGGHAHNGDSNGHSSPV
jgi:hypothetical protein